jgi:hypothetical protein
LMHLETILRLLPFGGDSASDREPQNRPVKF